MRDALMAGEVHFRGEGLACHAILLGIVTEFDRDNLHQKIFRLIEDGSKGSET